VPEAILVANDAVPVNGPVNPDAVSIPVDGTKLNLADVVFVAKLPVLADAQVGYTEVAVTASFVIVVVAEIVAVPFSAPVNPVDETDTNPAIVVADAPSAIEVVPTVIALFVNPPFGIPVKLVPVKVGVVENAGITVVEPTKTPAAPATIAGVPVAPVVATP